jgi:uncharacterized membrane protein YdjX (TVP38/TMEM64 family)
MTIPQFLEWLSRRRRLLGVVVLLLALALTAWATGLREQVTLRHLHSLLEDHGAGGVLVFGLLFVLGNLVQLPGWIFLAAAVLVLGRLEGGLVTYGAAVLSCSITFVTVRAVGGNAVAELDNRFARQLLAQLHAHPLRNVVLLRTLFQTLPAVNYALAMSGVRFWSYALGTVLGLPLPIAIYCLLVDQLAILLHLPHL